MPGFGENLGLGATSFLTEFLKARAQRNLMQQQIEQQKEEEDRNEAMKLRLARLTNPIQSPEAQFPNYRNLPGIASGKLSPDERVEMIPMQFRAPEAGMAAVNKLAAQRMTEAGESPEERAARVGKMTESAGGFVGERGNLERKRMLEDIARLARANRPEVAAGGVGGGRVPQADETGFVNEMIFRGYIIPDDSDWIPKTDYTGTVIGQTLNIDKIKSEIASDPRGAALWDEFRRTGTIKPKGPEPPQSDYPWER